MAKTKRTIENMLDKDNINYNNDVENSTNVPEIGSTEWKSYIMDQFRDGEIYDGHPNVNGLRRLATELIGPVISTDVAFLGITNNNRYIVKYTVVFSEGGPFSEIADVAPDNTEPMFLRHPTATAATRAEARIYRKLLQIPVASAEEMAAPALIETGAQIWGPEEEISVINDAQKNFINLICKKLNIDVMKYINSGKNQYEDINNIEYEVAQKMCRRLSELQNDINENKTPEWAKNLFKN